MGGAYRAEQRFPWHGARRMASATVFALSDALAALFCVQAVTALAPDRVLAVAPGLLLAVIVQIGFKAVLGLYPGFGLQPETLLQRGARAWGGAAATAVVAGQILHPIGAVAVATLLAVFASVCLAQLLFSHLLRRVMERAGLWGLSVHVRGEPELVDALIDHLNAQRRYGFNVVPKHVAASTALWAGSGQVPAEVLRQLRCQYAEVILVDDQPKLPLSGLRPADHGGAIGLRLTSARSPALRHAAKRAIDLTIAVPATIIAAPVILLAAVAIRLVDPGSAFYAQARDGLGGRTIRVMKLRTMYRDSDRMLAELLKRDPAARAEWEAHFKLRNDPRVLPVVGPLLRASSLDELPQLFNILRGDMSVIGPRPFPEYHLAAMTPEFRRRRSTVVPGLSGLWQISDRSEADVGEQEALDGYYLDNRSFWLDLSILLRTFSAVFGGKGAY